MPILAGRSFYLLLAYATFGGIAQLARALALQARGLGFESPYLQFDYHLGTRNGVSASLMKERTETALVASPHTSKEY